MDWCSSCMDVIGPWSVLIIISNVRRTKGEKRFRAGQYSIASCYRDDLGDEAYRRMAKRSSTRSVWEEKADRLSTSESNRLPSLTLSKG